MKKLIIVTGVALAAISFVSTAASAATVSASAGDLILGFENTDQNVDLEIDLGTASTFTKTYSATLGVVVNADLVAAFGSDWASQTDIAWGVAGVTSGTISGVTQTTNSFDSTDVQTLANVSTSNAQGLTAGLILNLKGALNGATATGNAGTNNKSAIIGSESGTPASSITDSYTYQLNNGSTDSRDFGGGQFYEGETQIDASQGPDQTLELYNFTQAGSDGTATDLGTFSLTSSGTGSSEVATFTYNGVAAAAPEPSAYALGICAMLLFWVLKRRSSIA